LDDTSIDAMKKQKLTQENVIDHILKFDPEDSRTASRLSSIQPAAMMPAALKPIQWPSGGKPSPTPLASAPAPNKTLPQADILIVTWTVAEALALSDVLTPGFRSKTDWYHYAHNWTSHFKPIIKGGAPSLQANRLGSWFPTKVGGKKVICFKSELHLARDGSKLPVKDLWQQLIAEVSPSLVITTGTAGGVGSKMVLGDVVVSRKVRFDCTRTFKNASFAQSEFTCPTTIKLTNTATANKLMDVTKEKLPDSPREPKLVTKPLQPHYKIDVVTTDFFAYDNSTDTFGLQSLGSAVEMGDAVLGMVCDAMGAGAPAWVAVRNASDPQMDGTLTKEEQVQMAARIYEKYGYWTTINSAIACWALIRSH
jgi:purine-nucleoside phosphorylase